MFILLDSLPDHEVINMPMLSPTMEFGKLLQWNFEEGDELMVGDYLCEVETDKATVGFEL